MKIPSSSSLVFATLALSSSSSNLSVLAAPTSETSSEASIGPSSSNHHIASRRGSFNFAQAERDSLPDGASNLGRGSFPHVGPLPRSSSSKRHVARSPSMDASDLHRRGGCEDLLTEVVGRITPLAPLGGALQPVLHTVFGLPVVGGILGGLCSDKAPHASGIESLQGQGQLSMQQAESSMQDLAKSIQNAFGEGSNPSSPPVRRAEQADASPTDNAPVKPPVKPPVSPPTDKLPVSPPSPPTDKLPVTPPSAPSPPTEKLPVQPPVSPPTAGKAPAPPTDKLPVQPPVSPPAPPNSPMPQAAAADTTITPPAAVGGTVRPPVAPPTVTPPVDTPSAKAPVQPPVAPPVAADPKKPGNGATVQTPPTVVIPMDPPTPGANAKSVEDGSDEQDGQDDQDGEDLPEDDGVEGDEPALDDESSPSAPSRRRSDC